MLFLGVLISFYVKEILVNLQVEFREQLQTIEFDNHGCNRCLQRIDFFYLFSLICGDYMVGNAFFSKEYKEGCLFIPEFLF